MVPERQSFRAAFNDYAPTLRQLVSQYPEARILELGGGRRPSFSIDDMPSNLASYTVNDIDPTELELASDDYDKAAFDVIGDVSAFQGKYDVVFSRTLIEHVADGRAMHQNVLKLLKPGGVAFHMAPTLYASPFVMNRLLPETFSRRVLLALFPKRRMLHPKFPAFYSWCFGNRAKMARMLRTVGYTRSDIRTFYGHDYFKRIWGARQVSDLIASVAARRDWSSLGAYAHIIAYK